MVSQNIKASTNDPHGWLDILYENFWIKNEHEVIIDPQGLIIKASEVEVRLGGESINEIPVPFLEVTGDFICSNVGLTTLKNAPKRVSGHFHVQGNKLQSLEHGPYHVGNQYCCHNNQLTNLTGAPKHSVLYLEAINNPLTSLEGLPPNIQLLILSNNATMDLPLLRCLTVQARVAVAKYNQDRDWDQKLNDILNDVRWAGQGKAGVLNCALELKKAGYGGNARW